LNEDETFFVVEGRVSFFKDGEWQEVTSGTAAFMPRGVVHTFKNVGAGPLRMLISTSPSGFETFFARCAGEFAKPGVPNMERIIAISAEHGIHFVTLKRVPNNSEPAPANRLISLTPSIGDGSRMTAARRGFPAREAPISAANAQ
jgi:hypothetical protein